MMTPEQIATWHQQARDNLFARKSIISPQDVLTEFARLVRNDALNDAVNECFAVDNTGDYVCHNRDDCADAIDAMKESKP